MPSRKKAKGKARKAAKEAKEKEEESQTVVNVADGQRQVQEGSLEARLQQLRISAASPTLCRHGSPCPSLSAGEEKICLEFINAYITAFHSQDNLGLVFATAFHATKNEYFDVHDSKLNTVISILLASGTHCILNGDNDIAQLYASLACYFEDCMALHNTQATILNMTKIAELHVADDHTLVSYYRKRIPCSCLDEKYKEVKSVKKMGRCYNLNCRHPQGRVERRKMLCCTRCGMANYCSVECHKADWKNHKEECNSAAEIAAFNSSGQT